MISPFPDPEPEKRTNLGQKPGDTCQFPETIPNLCGDCHARECPEGVHTLNK